MRIARSAAWSKRPSRISNGRCGASRVLAASYLSRIWIRRSATFCARLVTRQGLTREQLAELLGISGQVYGRYERAFSKMNVTRLIHLSEILGFKPIEMIYAAAPHLFGKTPKEAENRIRLMRLMSRMRPEAVDLLLTLVGELAGDSEVSSDAS